MLSKKALDEFKEIWLEEKMAELSDDELAIVAENLLLLMKEIYKPISTR